MQPQAKQVVHLIDAQGQQIGQMVIERREDETVFGRFVPGPAFPAVQHLFREFEEAVNLQALSVVEELDTAIAALGLHLRTPGDSQRIEAHDIQIWSDGSITCRVGSSALSMFQKIKSLLEAGELDRLIGLVESAVFEAKGPRPYDFARASSRWELAKDVASFANSIGGFIIIGLTHERLAEQDTDRVSALDLIEESVFEAHRYEAIVSEYVDRQISGLQVRWIEHKSNPGLGVGVIHIPPQSNDAKPFLLKQLDESGKTHQLVFGIVSRKGAHSVPSSMAELRKALRNGMSDVATRLTRVEEQLASLQEMLAAREQPVPPTDPLSSRIERVLED